MSNIDDYFPYASYRANQKELLETVAETVRKGQILMIDAPTGSGKSSVIAPLLAESNGRKILVAVRTISQLHIFIRELNLIRQKKDPNLKFVYLIGKNKMCQLGGNGDVYRRCEGLKTMSTSLMHQRADRGSMIPSRDKIIQDQIKKQDLEHPLLCPYFINSRVFIDSEDGSRKMIYSHELRSKSEKIAHNQIVMPNDLADFAGNLCAYDLMLSAARTADVIILNYYHLFNDDIREQLYTNLQCDSSDIILLLDESHNLGSVVQDIQSIRITETDVEVASHELVSYRNLVDGTDAIRHILPRISDFINSLKRSKDNEDWFDPSIFKQILIKGSLYNSFDEILEDISSIHDKICEYNIKKAEYRETALEKICEFLIRINSATSDTSYLTVYIKENDVITLEIQNIDPSNKLQKIISKHASTILISGTLSPLEAYKNYYFRDLQQINTISLPNIFPKDNRIILVTDDITTSYSHRDNENNKDNIISYIINFANTISGNIAVYISSYQMRDTFFEICKDEIQNKI
ncbi:MAG TPA: ATP-dependent DNA helicase, partial [Methanocorpusculum sp.]|nr:ATP-dependent DNA helicase [Methanocorpusculum sp.]